MIKLEGIALNVNGRRSGESDVEGIKVSERGLPCAVDGAVAFVHHHHVEIATGEFVVTADHGLQQADSDLFFLLDHTRLEPVAGIAGQQILNRFDGLLGQLVAIHQEQHALGLTRLHQAFEI